MREKILCGKVAKQGMQKAPFKIENRFRSRGEKNTEFIYEV